MQGLTPIQSPSPNFGPRRDGISPHLIVLHYTAMECAEDACQRLCDPAFEVSAHYLISRTGDLLQLVDEKMRAWHAGAGEWAGLSDINSRSIGIELDNAGDHPFGEPQMQRLERLLPAIMGRWGISAQGVIAHSDMAPGRKHDPGSRFDWQRLVRLGLAAPSRAGNIPSELSWSVFRTAARSAGYTAPCDDQSLLRAVRLRHCPQNKGPLSALDFAALPG